MERRHANAESKLRDTWSPTTADVREGNAKGTIPTHRFWDWPKKAPARDCRGFRVKQFVDYSLMRAEISSADMALVLPMEGTAAPRDECAPFNGFTPTS